MLWIKWLHIVFMVTWFAGLFYLPRLFVYHAMSEDAASRERFKIMERKLYYGIMARQSDNGVWRLALAAWAVGLLDTRQAALAIVAAYRLYCGRLLKDFAGRNTKSHVWFRWFNEFRC
jgi:putative membrane protein